MLLPKIEAPASSSVSRSQPEGSGETKPIKIDVEMSGDVGFFQIEEVLLPKISSSPAREHVEIYAGITGEDKKKYL